MRSGNIRLRPPAPGLPQVVSTTTVTVLISSEGLTVTGFPSASYSNVVHYFTVAAEDSYGNVITSYLGTVGTFYQFGSLRRASRRHTLLPAPTRGPTSLAPIFVSTGTQSISVSDGTLIGSESNILVNPRPQFVVNALADDDGIGCL